MSLIIRLVDHEAALLEAEAAANESNLARCYLDLHLQAEERTKAALEMLAQYEATEPPSPTCAAQEPA